jgi:ubiquinone/menaquinone biosynthesis C-methylase UbiE
MQQTKDNLWEKVLKPIFQLLVDEKPLRELYEKIDWKKESDRFCSPNLIYPHYYISQKFHGIEGGYLTPDAAVTYDAVTQYALPPNETWIREEVIKAIKGKPRKILDLGCGTGSTTIMLKKAFPEAEVVGLDLSPYMLVMADYKAQKAGLDIHWLHSKAEATQFPDVQFDLVTASLLFHETPPFISQAILQECFRLMLPGGQVIILDGNQNTLRHTQWLTNIFEEPYIQDYAAGSVDAWLGAAGFEWVRTEEVWWTNQVSWGMKPIPNKETSSQFTEVDESEFQGIPAF